MYILINIPDIDIEVEGVVIETKSPVEYQGSTTHVVDVFIKDADLDIPNLPNGWEIASFSQEELDDLIIERNREF